MRSDNFFSPISESFAAFTRRLDGRDSAPLALLAGMVCEAMLRGHVCLDLVALAAGELQEEFAIPPEQMPAGTLAEWRELLGNSPVAGPPGAFTPLILDDAGRLYLHRYRGYEEALSAGMLSRAARCDLAGLATLRERIDRYFPTAAAASPDWQKVAAALAATRHCCVISGGPGTGKTTTVVKVLALLLEIAGDRPLAIALAAPTGKAAARLKGSISKAKAALPCSAAIRERIPEEVRTLHRLLGTVRHSPQFRHHRDNPLPYDVVVVDEASMVDLPLMAKLVSALPEQARLILLGDKNQLASVEAGAVLGDICRTGDETRYSPAMRQAFGTLLDLPEAVFAEEPQRGPGDCLVTLQQNYRFDAASGIGRLSACVNAGQADAARRLLEDAAVADVAWADSPAASQLEQALRQQVVAGFSAYLGASGAAEALEKFSRFMILCALRSGPHGVAEVNRLAERILAERGLLDPAARWYKGRPIMITANDYNLGLFNGDTGILWPEDGAGSQLRAFFPDAAGKLRSLAPARLPAHDTVFASTVHKSQGSEFDSVLLLLPPHDSLVMTRELIYTGITRARQSVAIWGEPTVFGAALQRRVRRTSGLRDALWGATSKDV